MDDLKPSDLLREGLGLIEDERHWTKGAFHKHLTMEGSRIVEWAHCSVGALNYAARKNLGQPMDGDMVHTNHPVYLTALTYLSHAVSQRGDVDKVMAFNDDYHTKHADVVGKFKDALIAAEGAGD